MATDIAKDLNRSILEISDYFYQNKNGEGIKQLPALIGQLASYASQLQETKLPGYTGVMKNVMEAMELQDYILLADLLVYEVSPFLE